MFNFKFLTVLITISVLLSCSSDDDDMSDVESKKDYFPLMIDNSWDYTSVTSTSGDSLSNEQTLTLTDEEMINDTLFFDATSSNNLNLTTTGILSSGRLFKKEGRLQLKGQFDDFINELPAGISLPVDANIIPIYDKNAGSEAELFAESGSFSQSFNGLNLDVEFTLSSQNTGTKTKMEVNGTTYNNVITSSIKLNMEVNASPSGFPVTVPLLEQQDVLTVTHHFANETGMIKSEVITSFNFDDFSQLGVDLPDVNSSTVQELESNNLILP